MEQNTESWEAWRQNGIGASDSPIIMGKSKYLKPEELLQIKLGLKVYQPNVFITSLGHKFEPRARAQYNILNDTSYQPTVVEMADYPWLRASLDGFYQSEPMEIKYVGQKKFDAAESGDIEESHYIQMQHQMMVTGSLSCKYLAYTLTKDRQNLDQILTKTIRYNPIYVQDIMFPRLYAFWEEVKKHRGKLSERDSSGD
jgi:putative phage-type endonuclease